jgi:hypothetical protein
MTNDEAEKIFVELTKILDEAGLRWIADSVQDEIQLGSLVEINPSDLPQAELKSATKLVQPAYRNAIRTSAKFLVRREYSQKELLTMLVDAIEEIVIHGNACEDSILAYFSEANGLPAVQFVSDRQASEPIVSETGQIGRRRDAVKSLSAFLHELRAEATS